MEKALKEIDTGNGKVQDEKLSDLSAQVIEWWERLRPEENTFFEGVQRRSPTARRTIDLRVALSPNDDRSDAKARIDPLGLGAQEAEVMHVRRIEGADQENAVVKALGGLVE